MKKKNFILIIVCIIVAIIFLMTFIGNANKNPLIGFWQEVNDYNETIRIFEFNENGYLTEMTLGNRGNMNTNSYTYYFSERSQTVVIDDDTYRYSIKNSTLILYNGDYINSTWEKISNINFLEKEQKKRLEEEQKRQEEEQRRIEEQKRQEEEYERKLQELRDEYSLWREEPFRDAEIKLLGKWEKDNSMFRDTYEFFENGKVIHYASDSGKTYTGTYHVYVDEFNPSEEQLLQFENGNFVPSEYCIKLNYDNGMQNSYTLFFEEGFIRFRDNPYFHGQKFYKVN